jgi:myo-inositol 2-dehydrogenase / D-chiro-inositol 1-dehydrogenase
MTLRYGVIGFGRFGQLHARGIERTEGAALGAICTASAASAAAAAKAHPQARVLRDWRELMADPALDVIDVVTPNHLHAAMTIAALEAGKHVLLEKPMATTAADCRRIVETVERTGRLLAVGFELRLSIQWGRIKQLIDEGRIGRPRYVNIGLFRHPYRAGAAGWRHAADQVGSWILEEPVHFYDFAMWWLAELGDPVAVSAIGTSAGEAGMFDNFTSTIRFAEGAYATITQSLAGFGHHLVVEVAGTAGAIRATWSGADAASETPVFELLVGPAGMTPPERIALTGNSGEVFELEEQIRLTTQAFAAGRTLVGAREAAKSVIVCLEAERAVREGREVPLKLD